MRKCKYLIFFALIIALSLKMQSKEHHVDKSKKNMVKFISDAPVEDFEGTTDNIDGYLFSESGELKGTDLYFEVDLNTVDTGIGLRNRHMRENYLHTDKYPKTSYTGKIVEVNKIDDKHYKVKADGKFKVHGIEKDKKVEACL